VNQVQKDFEQQYMDGPDPLRAKKYKPKVVDALVKLTTKSPIAMIWGPISAERRDAQGFASHGAETRSTLNGPHLRVGGVVSVLTQA